MQTKKKYEKICPSCNKIIQYASAGALCLSKQENRQCRKCYVEIYAQDPDYKKRVSEKSKARGAGGLVYYQKWLKDFGPEKANELYEERKKRFSEMFSGEKNFSYGVVREHGTGRSLSGWYKSWFFRSLKELSYVVNVIEKHNWAWQTAESEEFVVPYYDKAAGKNRTYRADFIINGNIMVEIKPKRNHKDPLVLLKAKAARKFCKSKGWKYKIIDTKTLDYNKIYPLYISGMVKFMPDSEIRFILSDKCAMQ